MNDSTSKLQNGICPECSKEFAYYPSAYKSGVKIHCSRKCQSKAARIETVCPHCGKGFWYHRSWPRKYCSSKCAIHVSEIWKLSPGKPQTAIEYPCDNCGTILKIEPHTMKLKHHFCNRNCFGEWQSKARQGIPRPECRVPNLKLRKRKKIICEWCGKEFEAKQSHAPRRRFCSRKCASQNQTTLVGKLSHTWKGGHDSYYGPNWREQRRKARNRDNYTCQRCKISETEYGQELDVHHIVPFRTFGINRYKEANKLNNLISLCKSCHKIEECRP